MGDRSAFQMAQVDKKETKKQLATLKMKEADGTYFILYLKKLQKRKRLLNKLQIGLLNGFSSIVAFYVACVLFTHKRAPNEAPDSRSR